MANGMGQGTGARDRRSGETVRRGHGETENLRITLYASRTTLHELRITLYELRLEVTKNDAKTANVCHRCQHLHRPFGL
jgi:hypothetical protein